MGEKKSDLIPGTLDMLILQVVNRGEPMHGYSVSQAIEDGSDDVLQVDEGALYPALHRLEVRGLVRSRWGASENNRRAKFYVITAAGRRYLEEQTESWNRTARAIFRIMQTA